MKIVVLGSGSKGNSVYIETKESKILIDAGLTYAETFNRLRFKNIKLEKLDAVFITHEHTDHINGIVNIAKYTKADLYFNKKSFENLKSTYVSGIMNSKIFFIKSNVKYHINDLTVVPIKMSHDTANCYGFLIKSGSATYAHMTDTGIIDEKYFKLLGSIHTILIESNHDEKMLQLSNRPYFLKQRILSKKGHLSNKECVSYLKEIVTEKTKNVILAHLSEECNDEALALSEVKNVFPEMKFNLYAARQKEPLDIIEIGEDNV